MINNDNYLDDSFFSCSSSVSSFGSASGDFLDSLTLHDQMVSCFPPLSNTLNIVHVNV